MKNEFKAGDLVFELDFHGGIKLEVLEGKSIQDEDFCTLITRYGFDYSQCGRAYPSFKVPHLLRATTENRQALVTLYGEDAVPKLPLRGSELTRKMIKKQKYVLCWTAAQSDDIARKYEELAVIEFIDDIEGYFVCVDGHGYNHAVPVDMDGNEITEIE